MNKGISEFTQAFFDEASLAWNSNKIKSGQAFYAYKCEAVQKNGSLCGKRAVQNIKSEKHLCTNHYKWLLGKISL